MSRFMHETIEDLRGGRQSWRVITFLTSTAFAISFAAALLRPIV